jgi:uncharacterized protein
MRIVLDTNVLVAGLLSTAGPCATMVRMVSSGQLTLCLDARIVSEYREVLRRPKFSFDEDRVAALLEHIERAGEIVVPGPLAARLPDPEDETFLETAICAKAQCLVTGNMPHFSVGLRAGVEVLVPADFVEFYRSKQELLAIVEAAVSTGYPLTVDDLAQYVNEIGLSTPADMSAWIRELRDAG